MLCTTILLSQSVVVLGTTTHILASEKTWGDLLDILRSYIFHSGNSYPKFLTKKFSAALYFSFGKNEDSTIRMLYFHIGFGMYIPSCFYIKMFLSGIGKVLAIGNTYGIYLYVVDILAILDVGLRKP